MNGAETKSDKTALSLSGVRKNFGQAQIICGVDLDIRKGERHAIIGPNGAGKSTLFNLISGRYAPSAGRIRLNGRDVTGAAPFEITRRGLSRSFQITNIFARMSVRDNVRCGLLWSEGHRYAFWKFLEKQKALNEKADDILERTGLAAKRNLPAAMLPYADQRALELAITVAGGADVILLDEPTAGMSHSETEAAVALIRRITEGKTLVMVEHDMGVIFDLADRISVLVYGEIIATDTPDRIRANAAVQEAYLGAALEADEQSESQA